MNVPEFSRPERIDTIGAGARDVRIEADTDERTRLATRFGLMSIDRLVATFNIRRDADAILAMGKVEAAVIQACIATGNPVPAMIDEAVMLRFVPETTLVHGPDEEIELAEQDCDIIPYAGGAIDLGEAAAETVALALDPYPRSDGAEAALRDAGVLREDEAGPFGALAGLRDALKGN